MLQCTLSIVGFIVLSKCFSHDTLAKTKITYFLIKLSGDDFINKVSRKYGSPYLQQYIGTENADM